MRQRLKATAFSPFKFPGLLLWLSPRDYSTLTFNGSTISQITDKSGNGKTFTQGTALKQPTYSSSGINGVPALSYDGVATCLSRAETLIVNNFTLFVVVKSTNGASSVVNEVAFKLGSNDAGSDVRNEAGTRKIIHPLAETLTAGSATTSPEIWALVQKSTTASFWVNNVNKFSESASSPVSSATNLSTVGSFRTDFYFWNGLIGDVLVYNRTFSESEIIRFTNGVNRWYNRLF